MSVSLSRQREGTHAGGHGCFDRSDSTILIEATLVEALSVTLGGDREPNPHEPFDGSPPTLQNTFCTPPVVGLHDHVDMVVIEQLPTALIRGLKGAYSQTMASFPLSLLSSQLARLRRSAACCLTGLVLLSMVTSPLSAEELELRQGDHVIIVGGTMPERMQQFNHFETRMQIRHPELELYVRDLAWSADEVALRPRSQAFQDHGHSLQEHGATVVLAFWGFNESFGGEAKLGEFETNLNRWIDETNAIKTADDREMKIVLRKTTT